jgi:hypothetical protein
VVGAKEILKPAMFGHLTDSFNFVYRKDKSPRLTQKTRLLQISLIGAGSF